MRIIPTIVTLLACSPLINALIVPEPDSFSRGDPLLAPVQRDPDVAETSFVETLALGAGLEKRRGGGGGSKGGSSSSSGSKSGSSGSKTGGKTGSSSSSSSSPKSYGGGRFYGGGSPSPYTAGKRSPRGITPFILPIAALSFFPGVWLYSAYAYPYTHPVRYFNRTDTNSTFPNGMNRTLPALCLCQEYSSCGCDDNTDPTYISDLLGNGSWAALNKSLVQVSDVNSTRTLVLNGTLANVTTEEDEESGAARVARKSFGWWLLGAIVGWTIWMT